MLELTQQRPGLYRATPGEDWSQGRAAYGGYVAAAALRAATREGHNRPLLSAQVSFLAPASSKGFEIEIEALRVGKGTSVVEARVASDGALAAKILFTFGVARGASVALAQSAQDVAQWQRLRAQTPDTPHISGVTPRFLAQFQFRPLVNGVPFAASKSQDHLIAFCPRFDFDGTWAEYMLLLSDINPPPPLMLVEEPCPASTATWMCKLEFPQQSTPVQDWFYVAIHLDTAAGGYGQHNTMIFDAAGHHVSSNHQVTTVFERDGGQKTLANLPRRLTFRTTYSLFKGLVGLRGLFKRGNQTNKDKNSTP